MKMAGEYDFKNLTSNRPIKPPAYDLDNFGFNIRL